MKQHCLHGDGFPHLLIRNYLSQPHLFSTFKHYWGNIFLSRIIRSIFGFQSTQANELDLKLEPKISNAGQSFIHQLPVMLRVYIIQKRSFFFNPGNFLQLKSTKFLICESICMTYKVCFIRYQLTWHKGFIILQNWFLQNFYCFRIF